MKIDYEIKPINEENRKDVNEILIEESECEIVSLNSFIKEKGIGTELVEKVKQYAKQKQYKNQEN